jgi:5-methylcytosine-specific restriction enzyme subunit McrC
VTSPGPPTVLVLEEFGKRSFSRRELPDELGDLLWQEHGSKPECISVEFPSPKTGNHWALTNQGWVGLLPLGPDRTLSLKPKVPISNVFRMLELAYRLDVFRGPESVVGAGSMQEVYESLARVLARRVRDRGRKGLYRTYVGLEERLPVVRGRLDLRRLPGSGPDPRLHCLFEEHTPDHADNQILLHALDRIVHSGLCRELPQREVRDAHRVLWGTVSPVLFTERETLGRPYNRLNHDYRGLHALARFFIAHTGPTQRHGGAQMTPFLVEMSRLFEQFVGAWLRENLPEGLSLREQESGSYDPEGEVGYRIDMVLSDEDGRTLAVLDTKYKKDDLPSAADVAQVLAYATKKGCSEAILVYPWDVGRGKAFTVGGIRVRTLGFPLGGDLEAAGRGLLDGVLGEGKEGPLTFGLRKSSSLLPAPPRLPGVRGPVTAS